MVIGPLFHWSPSVRRAAILRHGLRINSAPTVDSTKWNRICFSLSPSHAWAHSGQMVGNEGEAWDLWQVQLNKSDEVDVLPVVGNIIGEVRVHNNIAKERLWLVGTRAITAADLSTLALLGH